MSINPTISYLQKNPDVLSPFVRTMVITGQSNTATAGLYKDIDLMSIKQINTQFGASSHIASQLREVATNFSNSIIKPKVWAISYADNVSAVARVLTSVVSGTATADRLLKIKVNSLNPDRVMASQVAVQSLILTSGSRYDDFATGITSEGNPQNATDSFNPVLSKIFDNDTIVEVNITNGMTAAQAATAINAAINASATSIYGSSVSTATLTITSKHKGALSNNFAFEYDPSTTKDLGLAFTLVEATAGSGVVDATTILDIENDQAVKLSDLNFDYIVLPYGYSVSALVNDAKLKRDNVLNYNNRCLNYYIFRATALDMSTNTAINSLASAEPLEVKGLVKSISILEIDGIAIRAISNSDKRKLIESKQFTPIQKEDTGKISIGNIYTLYSEPEFANLELELAAGIVREAYVEIFVGTNKLFHSASFTTGTSVKPSTLDASIIKEEFRGFRDVLDGTNINSQYGATLAGLLSNSLITRERHDEILDKTFSFNKSAKLASVEFISELTQPLKALQIINQIS